MVAGSDGYAIQREVAVVDAVGVGAHGLRAL